MQFSKDFEINPKLLSKAKLVHCFKQAKFGIGNTVGDTTRLGFNEWLECLGRCALLAFNFEPSTKIPDYVNFASKHVVQEL